MSTLHEASLEGAGLCVAFCRSGDRYAHTVELAAANAPWLRSVEGTPADAWPPSPPWQSLHLERRGERQLALLVGMAGHSHWSMSVELDPGQRTVEFDVACRMREPAAGALGSVYRADRPLMQPDHWRASWQIDRTSNAALEIISDPSATTLATTPGGLAIRAAAGAVTAFPCTIRWAYRLSWQYDKR